MNKTKISKIGRRGKIGLTILVALMFIGIASAAIIPHFGGITTTATVDKQAVELSADGTTWLSYNVPVTHTIPDVSPGGTYCFKQWVRSNAAIPVDATFTRTDVYGAEVTTTYSIPDVYEYEADILGKTGSPPTLNVKVEDTGDGWLKWTYTGDDTTRDTPKMTVAIDYPDGFCITTFDDGSHDGWYYSPDPYDPGTTVEFADYSGGTHEDWVVTTASGNVMTVKILKSHLGDSFKWHGYGNFYNGQCWINPTETGYPWDASLYQVNLWQSLPVPFTLQPEEQLQFRICHTFDLHIGKGTYTLTIIVDAEEHI